MTAITKNIRRLIAAASYAGPTPEVIWRGTVDVRADAARTVYAKRVGLHDRLHARGRLTDAEWAWACRYVREYEIASGGRPDRPDCEAGEPYHGPLIYNRQCAAIGFLRRTHERITAQERLVLIAACVECAVVVDLGPLLGLRRKEGELDDAYKDRIKNRVAETCVRIIRQASGSSKRAETEAVSPLVAGAGWPARDRTEPA